MKIIEGLKQIKDLMRKAQDLREKIQKYHADMDFETPAYGSEDKQRSQIAEWLQSHEDLTKEITSLRRRIQLTNCMVDVTIRLGEKSVTKKIAEWISRRKDLAGLDLQAWSQLNDRGLKESAEVRTTTGDTKMVKMRRYYNPQERDKKRELYSSEPSLIDAQLEIVNATTDILE